MKAVTEEDIEALTLGAHLLGAGGGGLSDLIAELVSVELGRIGELAVHEVADLPPDTLCLPVAQVGSSTQRSERLPVGDEVLRLIAAAEAVHGQPVGAIAWIEAAGANLFVPMLASAVTGIPLVDADGMGRAYSSIVQTSYEVYGIRASPVILVGARGETITIQAEADQLELLVRPAVETLGGWAMGGWYAQSAAQLARSAIVGTIDAALTHGRSLLTAGIPQGSRLLVSGRVSSIESMVNSGLSVVVTSSSEPEQVLRIVARDTCLVALLDGKPVAAIPEIIAPISHELASPVNIEALSRGQSVDVWAVPAPPLWTRPPAYERVNPTAHGVELTP
jgi:DUF917 family protein